jgi:hypothetical protein
LPTAMVVDPALLPYYLRTQIVVFQSWPEKAVEGRPLSLVRGGDAVARPGPRWSGSRYFDP